MKMTRGCWKVVVLAYPDLGLLSGNVRAGHRPEMLRELQRLHVPHTVRKLHVGDFVWVAQETRPRDPGMGTWAGMGGWPGWVEGRRSNSPWLLGSKTWGVSPGPHRGAQAAR